MLYDANYAYSANNSQQRRSNADMHIVSVVVAWADAYNSVVNTYNAHDTAYGSYLSNPCACLKLTRFYYYAQFKTHTMNGRWWRKLIRLI